MLVKHILNIGKILKPEAPKGLINLFQFFNNKKHKFRSLLLNIYQQYYSYNTNEQTATVIVTPIKSIKTLDIGPDEIAASNPIAK